MFLKILFRRGDLFGEEKPKSVRDAYPTFKNTQVDQFRPFFRRMKNAVHKEKGSFGTMIETQILNALTTF